MWFLGVVVGLIIGGMMESFGGAMILAVLGGWVAHAASRPKPTGNADSLSSGASSPTSSDSPDTEVEQLRLRVATLEQRVHALEARLADVPFAPADSLPDTRHAVPDIAEAIPEPISPGMAEWDHSLPQPAALASAIETGDSVASVRVEASDTDELAHQAAESKAGDPDAAPPAVATPILAFSEQAPSGVSAEHEPAHAPAPSEAATSDGAAASGPLPTFVFAELAKPKPRVAFKDRLPAPIRNLIYGGNTLVKMGVLILFLGLAFLLRYTAERVTVPIELRYAGVALVGAGLLGLGWFLRRRREDYALIMQGMGVGVFYLTTLAAMKLNSLLPSEAGFGFMFAVSLLGAALAILQNAPMLAIIAALEGFATPILTSTGGNHMMGLMTYLSILDVGIVLVAWFNAWRILNVIGFVGTFTLASGWANQYYTDDQYLPVQAFLTLFFLLFTAVGILFARRTLLDARSAQPAPPDSSESSEAAAPGTPTPTLTQQAKATLAQVGRVDSALVFGTPLTAFGLQYLLTRPWEFGPAFSALALSAFYLLLARLVFSRERVGLALLAEAYAIMGVIFATLAIPLGFEGVWTGAAWAVEGAGMYWLGVRQDRAYSRAFAYLVMLGASYKLLLSIGINENADLPLLYGSTIGPILLAFSAFSIWHQNHRAKLDLPQHWEAIPGRLVLWLGMVALTVLPWQWFVPQTAAAATAVLSAGVYFIARRFNTAPLFAIVASLQVLAVTGFALTLHLTPETRSDAVLDGGLPGLFAALTIAASILLTAGWSIATARKAALDENAPATQSSAAIVAVVAGSALLHPALLFEFSLQTTAAATAALSVIAYLLQRRFDLRPLSIAASFLQGLGVVSFMLTLQRATDAEVNAVLDSGWHGLLAALIIATSILFTTGWSMARTRRTALDNGLSPAWSRGNVVAVIAGTVLLHLAMLFALSLEQVALVWPLTSCAVFWVALRMAHTPLALLTAGFQAVSAGVFLDRYKNLGNSDAVTPFAHLQFWTPVVLGLVAWLCGDWIRAEAKYLAGRMATENRLPGSRVAGKLTCWSNPWCSYPRVLWLPVVWGLIWWMAAWFDETSRVLDQHALSQYVATSAVAIILATSVAVAMIARWRDWSQMGTMSLLTLPALILSVYPAVAVAGADYLPSANLGVLAWPLALLWHLRLMRRQSPWASSSTLQALHVAGFWFFLLLASRECQAQFSALAAEYSSWSMLGWVVVPALCFWALRSPILEKRWPLTEFRHAYLEIACVPVAAYLLSWCFASNLLSSGDASPLPNLPLLNPLELGHWLVLLALLLWWRALPETSVVRVPSVSVKILAGAMGWFLLTAMVLRACHHWGGVAWEASALFDSRMTQAALSIAWAIMGMSAMLLGNRRASRTIWITGATLLAVVVVKLFLVELADRGGLYRIVSFIGVGVLLLIVGYFAPVPVKAPPETDGAEKEREGQPEATL